MTREFLDRQRSFWREERGRHGAARATLHRVRHALGIGALEVRVEDLEALARAEVARADALRGEIETLEARIEVWETTAWLEHADLAAQPLISVILPTRDRLEHLGRAIRSVRAQSYEHWELVVVDDGAEPGAAAEIARGFGDDRVVAVPGPRRGVSAARNCGLDVARGGLVAYLDDDNLMEPQWLKGVAWAFESWPATDVVYGARLFPDARIPDPRAAAGRAVLEHVPFSRAALEDAMLTDLGAIAHRRGLPEARFDETLDAVVDWDLLLRLTEVRAPLRLPVIALRYFVDAPNRISKHAEVGTAIAVVRGRTAGRALARDPSMREAIRAIRARAPGRAPTVRELEMLRACWPSPWSASVPLLGEMLTLAERTDAPVLECGSGLSTILLGLVLGPDRLVVALEHDPYWYGLVAAVVDALDLPGARVHHAPLRAAGAFDWYDVDGIDLPARFGLALCDGPPGDVRGGRVGLLPALAERLDGAVIFLDDADRPGEVRVRTAWRDEWGLELAVRGSGKDCFAVGTYERALARSSVDR